MARLTKSRFKLGMECPTKIYYASSKQYNNRLSEDPFLRALADGGFQMEAYIKDFVFDGRGHENTDRSKTKENLENTREWLKKENTLIHEAAIEYEDLLVYVDSLQRDQDTLNIYEIKAKSADGEDGFRESALGTKVPITAKWRPYLWDIAFQTYVVQKAYPGFKVKANLILADKSAVADMDGLNQMYRINRKGDFDIEVLKPNGMPEDHNGQLVLKVNVDDIIEQYIFSGVDKHNDRTFTDTLALLREYAEKDIAYPPILKPECKNCQFRDESGDPDVSGWHRCWLSHYSAERISQPKAMDLWNIRSKNLFEEGIHFIDELTEDHLALDEDPVKFTSKDRQWTQIRSVKDGIDTDQVKGGLAGALNDLTYPLNFIDFEASTAALPFFSGMSPYEQVAFQFSHHIMHEDGSVEHKSQFLSTAPGEFPNFEMVRALKNSLTENTGTIFRYSSYENTILNKIYEQLEKSKEDDKSELQSFISDITKHKLRGQGLRNMVDLFELVKDYWYHPAMGGSISIKKVLPASLESAPHLKEWLAQPMSAAGISSLNDPHHIWLPGDSTDPYQSLAPLFADLSEEELEELIEADEKDRIIDGAGAMMAYRKLQYVDITGEERERTEQGLLQYCELDTLAMVVVFKKLLSLTEPQSH